MEITPLTIALVAAGLLYFWYASIISRRNKVHESFSSIDVQLKKRTDLVPNILKIASKFMDHEKSLLEEITALRTEVLKSAERGDNHQERFKLEAQLQDKLSGLMVSVENYPDLKSQETMVEAQRVYSDVEENISAARRSYNANVTALRNSIQIFPGSLIAAMAGVKNEPMFEIADTDRKPVDASNFLN